MKISIAGVDEVGRGSLIGPVYAAAVIFKNNFDKKKIRDSKKLTKKNREMLRALAVYVRFCDLTKKFNVTFWTITFERSDIET